MGVLHHANFFTYFEMGRTELLRANGRDYRDVEAEGTFMVVVRIGCRYLRPARYDDVLTLRTNTTRVTAAKIEHEYQLLRGEELLAKGTARWPASIGRGRCNACPNGCGCRNEA